MHAPIDDHGRKLHIDKECPPNNKVFSTSSYHSVVCTKCVNVSVNVTETSLYMATQKAQYNLESIVCGHHVYKYIWIHCIGEQLSLHTNMEIRTSPSII